MDMYNNELGRKIVDTYFKDVKPEDQEKVAYEIMQKEFGKDKQWLDKEVKSYNESEKNKTYMFVPQADGSSKYEGYPTQKFNAVDICLLNIIYRDVEKSKYIHDYEKRGDKNDNN